MDYVTSGGANASTSIQKDAKLPAHLGDSMNYLTVFWTNFPPNSSLLLFISFHSNFTGFWNFRPHSLCAFFSLLCHSRASVSPSPASPWIRWPDGLPASWRRFCGRWVGGRSKKGRNKLWTQVYFVSLRSNMKQEIWVFVRLGYEVFITDFLFKMMFPLFN